MEPGSESPEASWVDFILRPKRAIDRAVAAGKLFEPWAILILIEWLPLTAILCIAAERTANPKYFLVGATILVVGLFLAVCLNTFFIFGCLWAFTRVFGARGKSREFAIAFAVAARGPTVAGAVLIVSYGIAAMLRAPTEAAGHSNWGLILALIFILLTVVWYAWLLGKAIRAVYEIIRFGIIFTIVIGGLVLPAVVPTDWMSDSFVDTYRMASHSMRPTVNGRDHLMTNNAAYGIRSTLFGKYLISLEPPRRGDLIVFVTPEAGEDYLKRVVAVSGDTIGVVKNRLVINGETMPARRIGERMYNVVDEKGRFMGRVRSTLWVEKLGDVEYSILQNYCDSDHGCYGLGRPTCDLDQKTCLAADFAPHRVPEGHVFVMGDNRQNSRDSRYFGFVPIDNVKGQVILRYLPFARSGVIKSSREP
jgi:signal peptidase I